MKTSEWSPAEKVTSPDEVVAEVERIHSELFGQSDSGFIAQSVHDVCAMFEGQFGNFQASDTIYHDLEHTLQATLCWAHLFEGYTQNGGHMQLDQRDFRIGLLASLLHDIGYLKDESDEDGTGAKFTCEHERRSSEMAQLYLFDREWRQRDIFAVQHLISCTGPRAFIDAVPFRDEREEVLGMMLCTADYLGQMSDPRYLEKLPILFQEFEESDNFRDIPPSERIFHSAEELIQRTPDFWRESVLPKLNDECGRLYQYLAKPYPDGSNPYIERIEEHLDMIARGTVTVHKVAS